jgi:hypothetical protein
MFDLSGRTALCPGTMALAWIGVSVNSDPLRGKSSASD